MLQNYVEAKKSEFRWQGEKSKLRQINGLEICDLGHAIEIAP